jgi:ferredoxin
MKTCYFTATGNSLYVAKQIEGELLSIPQLMKEGQLVLSDDAVGIVCPVYGGEMPKMVRKFLKKASIRTEYLFFINTYGMSDSLAKSNAVAAAAEAQLKVSYVNSIKMVDNFLPGFEMQKQMDTAGEKKIDEQIAAVCQDIAQRKVNAPSLGPVQKAGMALIHATMGKVVLKDTAAQNYIVNENCIRCGICAKVCPANNITVLKQVVFGYRCENCYACLHNCPKNAIHLKHERSAARFRNEHVTLQELIEANK